MPFEFAFLDWLYQFRNPVMNTISIFFDYAGAHGEIWIAFTLLLLLFRRTRKAGFAMAVALVLYMAAGHFFLKPLFARPRPCDLNTSITMLVARPHGHSFPSGHTASGVAAAYALWLQNRKLGAPALVLAAFIAFTRLYLYVHFPTDILGGAVLGIVLGAAASAIANYVANHKEKQRIVYSSAYLLLQRFFSKLALSVKSYGFASSPKGRAFGSPHKLHLFAKASPFGRGVTVGDGEGEDATLCDFQHL